jgi:glycosyltransferase involved in cell wall biosynthesis
VLVLALFRQRNREHWLADLSDSPPAGGWPRLAVIFAARDEASGVEQATRSMLAQDYPELVVIAVDDRSTDATGAILDALAGENPRLRVVHLRESLPGWLGKTNALHVAATAETAPWLLFTDADVQFEPGTLRRALAWAIKEGADHVTVVPKFVTAGIGERLFLMVFELAFATRVLGGRVDARRGGTHLGIGAFNLVRSEALRGIGGFERLALSVDDDNRLAQALKAAGHRARAIMGVGAVSVRWQTGLGGLIRGLEKNLFAILDFRIGLVAAVCVLWLGIGFAPYICLIWGPWWVRIVCATGIAALVGILSAATRQTGIAWYYALALPLSASLYVLALIRSTWLTLARRGVRWRDCHYELHELRKHVRLRNTWLRGISHSSG